METFIKGVILSLSIIVLLSFFALIAGTIIYLIWPIAIPAVFPGLIESGTIAKELDWWPAVCLTWICSILIKSTISTKN
jgi:hypothetical protein